MPAKTFAYALAALSALVPVQLRADNGWDRAVFTLTEENDSKFSDRHYTQGLKLGFLSRDHTNENWLSGHLPSIGYKVARWKWGLEAGQQMFTPEILSETKLIENDRPYAGWLYGGLVFQQRGTNGGGTGMMGTFRLQAGVVGPESEADDAQIYWHGLWGFQHPSGWHHQLKTEVGLQLAYDRRHRYAIGDEWSVQVLPEAGCNLGNVRTDFHAGGTLRAGYNIPNEFGLNDSRRGADLGVHLFGGYFCRAVLLDLFLDGNNFRPSPHVEKEPFIGEARFGVAITGRHAELSVAHVHRTFEFSGQKERDGFTSLTLTLKF